MKSWFFCAFIFFSFNVLKAQVVQSSVTTVSKKGEVLSFSANLSQGSLTFTKTFTQNSSGIFQASYTLSNPFYNSGKPMEVQLNRQSFDMYFKTTTELWATYNQMIKRAQDKNLAFTDEKGWTALMEYYNIYMVK